MQRYFRVRELTSAPNHGGRYPICRATLWRWVKRLLILRPNAARFEAHRAADAAATGP